MQPVELTIRLTISPQQIKELHNKENMKIALLRYCIEDHWSRKWKILQICTGFHGSTLCTSQHIQLRTTHKAPMLVYIFFFSFFFSISFHSTIMSTHFDYVGWFASLNTDI